MASLEQQLEALLTREAIRDLPLRYCDCVWRDDYDGIVDLFAEDGAFIMISAEGEKKIAGHKDLHALYRDAAYIMPRPYIHNHVIELTGSDRASGRCCLDLRSARKDMSWHGAGFYEDDYVKVGEDWKFQTRRFHALHLEEMPAVLAPS